MAIVFDANGNLVDTEDNINFFNRGTEQVFPKQGLEPLYPNFGAPMVNDTSFSPDLPYDTLRFVDNNSLSLQPNYLMPNTNKVPQLPANRLEGLPSLNLQSLPANMGVANEEDVEQVDSLTGQKKSSGLADLFRTLIGFAVPGANFFLNQGSRAMDGIRSLNQKIQQSDFGRSRTGAEYGMLRRERKQGERAQQAMPDVYRSAKEKGFTNDRGGFSTQRADRAGTSLGSGQFSSKRSTGRQGY
jgi:hypothetical protein